MSLSELGRLPNLISLSRVALAPLAVYLLARPGYPAMIACAGIMVLAGITDALDGWLARRRNQITPLGIALDPIADKLFAGILLLGLIVYREFPIWLAAAILGRDFLIMTLGVFLLRGRDITLPSNLTGKYAFAAIAVLLASYVVRFPFGIEVFTWLSLILLLLSGVGYARVFAIIQSGETPRPFADRPYLQRLRLAAILVVAAIYLTKLFFYYF